MPKLFKLRAGEIVAADDPYTSIEDDQDMPRGDVIVSLARFRREGEWLLDGLRRVGVRLAPDEFPESLANELGRLCCIALVFPKFRDGRAYSAARILRDRLGFERELRAVGEVLIDQGRYMVRCGFDAFAPADTSTPEQWTAALHGFRHVYQRASDDREPAFVERERVA